MPSAPTPDRDAQRDTDHVSDRTLTRRHGDDVDDAAERSSGFDLDDHEAEDPER